MKARIVISLIALIFLWSCASTMQYTWIKENYQGKKFNNILVIAISQNLEARTVFENTISDYLKAEGINASNSLSLFPPVLNIDGLNEEQVEAKIRSGNYDAVLASSLVNVNSRDVTQPGVDYYYPVRYRYRGYVYSHYVYAYTPNYYREEKSYVLETRLFDAAASTKEEAIVWSGQSSITDPSSFYSASKTYAKKLVKTLIDSGTIKK